MTSPSVRITYEPDDNVIEVDATGVHPTPRVIDQIFDRLLRAARVARQKPHVLTCWAGVQLDLESAKQYGKRMEELKPLIVSVVRYSVPDGTKVQIRSESIKHRLNDKRTEFFETRAEALAAIRAGTI